MIKVTGQFIGEIDFSELTEATTTAIDALVGQVANSALGRWDQLARETLKTGRSDYLKGLQDTDSFKQTGRHEYEIALVGFLPNALESGMDKLDLKPGLLGGKSAKVGRSGFRYATVPFRHFASSKTADRAPQPSFAKELKDIVQKTGLNRVGRDAAGKPITGKVKTVTGTAGVVKKLKAYHATTPLEGLTKYQHVSPKGAVSSQLMTFRTVSDSPSAKAAAARRGVSWDASWTHPGLRGIHLLPKVAEWAEDELEQGIQKILEG